MTISLVVTEQNWNNNAMGPVTRAGVTFDLEATGNKAIFSFDAECQKNTYTGHLHLVPDPKKFPDIEKFHISVVSCNGKNVKVNYFGNAEKSGGTIKIVNAKTDNGNKQEPYSNIPLDLKTGLTLLLQNDIFINAIS